LETLESSSEGYYRTWALLKSNYCGKPKSEVYGIGITRRMDDILECYAIIIPQLIVINGWL
jgi:hypothetical protein